MKTIREEHDEWAERVVPENASEVQRQKMERSFYSGALMMYTKMAMEVTELTQEEAEEALNKIRTELMKYFGELVLGDLLKRIDAKIKEN